MVYYADLEKPEILDALRLDVPPDQLQLRFDQLVLAQDVFAEYYCVAARNRLKLPLESFEFWFHLLLAYLLNADTRRLDLDQDGPPEILKKYAPFSGLVRDAVVVLEQLQEVLGILEVAEVENICLQD